MIRSGTQWQRTLLCLAVLLGMLASSMVPTWWCGFSEGSLAALGRVTPHMHLYRVGRPLPPKSSHGTHWNGEQWR
jgi:hypothetical protein